MSSHLHLQSGCMHNDMAMVSHQFWICLVAESKCILLINICYYKKYVYFSWFKLENFSQESKCKNVIFEVVYDGYIVIIIILLLSSFLVSVARGKF